MTYYTYYTDRSRISLGQDCPRARYWNYHYKGRGIVKKGGNLPLIVGIHIHNGLAKILAEYPMAECLKETLDGLRADLQVAPPPGVDPDRFIKEQLFMAEVLLRLWVNVRLPYYRANYTVVSIEQEFEFPLPKPTDIIGASVIDMVRLDAVLRRKSDNSTFILEFKTTSRFSPDWFAQWYENLQVMLNIEALEHHLSERVSGLIIEGLNKGKFGVCASKTSQFAGQQIQNSPLCYGYVSKDGKKITSKWSFGAVHFFAGEKYTPEDWAGCLLSWGEGENLFGTTGEISPAPELRAEIVEQTYRGELRYHADLKAGLKHISRNLNMCNKYGYPCAFKDVCFQQGEVEFPDGYQQRMPHHATEAQINDETTSGAVITLPEPKYGFTGKEFKVPLQIVEKQQDAADIVQGALMKQLQDSVALGKKVGALKEKAKALPSPTSMPPVEFQKTLDFFKSKLLEAVVKTPPTDPDIPF